jgi:hypothetical protein
MVVGGRTVAVSSQILYSSSLHRPSSRTRVLHLPLAVVRNSGIRMPPKTSTHVSPAPDRQPNQGNAKQGSPAFDVTFAHTFRPLHESSSKVSIGPYSLDDAHSWPMRDGRFGEHIPLVQLFASGLPAHSMNLLSSQVAPGSRSTTQRLLPLELKHLHVTGPISFAAQSSWSTRCSPRGL